MLDDNLEHSRSILPPPSPFAISLILGAAILHALWNAIVKGSSDRLVTIGLIGVGNALFGLPLVFTSSPPAAASYLFIAATIAIHLFYFLFLNAAYRLGDFSQMYPLARGVAPLLVACGGLLFAGDHLSTQSWFGLVLISLAIGVLVVAKGKVPSDPRALAAAILTGFCIAGYTIVDGLGVRLSGSPIGYIGWSFVLQLFLGLAFLYYRRAYLSLLPVSAYVAGIGGGIISGLAYGLAMYAMTLTTLAAVSGIRESSVIIAALIGVLWFGERPWLPRIFSACLVVLGILMLSSTLVLF